MENNTNGVLLVTAETVTEQAVATALESSNGFESLSVCRTLPELVNSLRRGTTRAVVVDIDPDPIRMLGELDSIISKFIDSRFVLLSGELRQDLVLEAMQIGARNLLPKESVGSDLAGILHRFVSTTSEQFEKEGALVTLLSAGGGCGTTTVAVNLANELQILSSEPTLLVDLDTAYGSVATYLGLQAQYGMNDVLSYSGPLDPQLISSTASSYEDRLYVLASPASTDFMDASPLNLDPLDEAIAACKRAYSYTVVDAPRIPMEHAAKLAAQSTAVFIVLQLSIRDIRIAQQMLNGLKQLGVPQDRTIVLVNRYQKRKVMIPLEKAEKLLQGTSLRTLSNDFPNAMKCCNYGKLLARLAPKSALRAEVLRLANQVSKAHSNVTPMMSTSTRGRIR